MKGPIGLCQDGSSRSGALYSGDHRYMLEVSPIARATYP